MALGIEDYALIGDCETAALVGKDGSIDWLCWPDFSSPACFAALIGTGQNGRWLLAPKNGCKRTSRRYREHTLILETRFETATGTLLVTDFMPVRETHSDVVRITGVWKAVSRFGWNSVSVSIMDAPFHGKGPRKEIPG